MLRKFGIVTFCIVYMTMTVADGQEMQVRMIRKADMDCAASLAAQPDECCKMPKFFEDSIVAKCVADFGKDGQPAPPTPGVPSAGCCVSECILNTTKILVDGKFDKNQAVTIFKASTTDPKWIDVMTKALDTCEKEQNDMKDKQPAQASDPANNKCHPVSGAMLSCVKSNMFQNCPDYRTEPNCATLKTQISTCPMALMKH